MDTAIEVRQLVKTYAGDVRAVRDINFDVHRGEVFGLLGPNGAGKSTTVGMLTTTVAPSSGAARLAGFDVVRSPLAARSVSSVVFQEAVVDRALTGRRNLDIHARLWRVAPSEAGDRIAELSETLGLAELLDRPVGTLQRRRAAAARDRPRARLAPAACSSSTSRRSASTRASAHELLDVIAGLRDRAGDDDPAHDPLPRRGRAALRPGRDHARGPDRRARHARARCGPTSASEIVELRVRDAAGGRARPRCATAASPATTRSPSAPRSRSRSTTTTTPSRSPRSSGRGSHRQRSRPASRRSTTSTCD